MKSLVVYLALIVALLLSTTSTKAGVTVQLKSNAKTVSLGEVKFLYQKEELPYSDTAGDFPVIVHEELAKRLGPADWTIIAFSGGNIVLLKETNTGFDYYHLLHDGIECLPYPEYDLLAKAIILNELEPGDVINVGWDKEGIDFFANNFQLLKKINEETAQFRK